MTTEELIRYADWEHFTSQMREKNLMHLSVQSVYYIDNNGATVRVPAHTYGHQIEIEHRLLRAGLKIVYKATFDWRTAQEVVMSLSDRRRQCMINNF